MLGALYLCSQKALDMHPELLCRNDDYPLFVVLRTLYCTKRLIHTSPLQEDRPSHDRTHGRSPSDEILLLTRCCLRYLRYELLYSVCYDDHDQLFGKS